MIKKLEIEDTQKKGKTSFEKKRKQVGIERK